MRLAPAAYNNRMKRFWERARKWALSAAPYLLIAAILLSVLLFPAGESLQEEPVRVVRVWNVDTFEGGRGSRAAFLRRIAGTVKREGVYYLVTDYTIAGAREAASRGELPDLASYGIGLGGFLEHCLPLPYGFSGGEAGGKTYAVPWCRGQYYLFSRDGTFAGNAAVSAGGSNLSCVAAAFAGIRGEEAEPLAAYSGFLSGKYGVLLGTQRDVCRFMTRGVEVAARPLSAYNDLYEVVSVYSAEKFGDCLAFIDALRAEAAQKALEEIGMLPFSEGEGARTASVFSDDSALAEMRRTAAAENAVKNLDKFLKTV